MKYKIINKSDMDFESFGPILQSFLSFATKRFGFKKPPRLFFVSDPENASKPLGKTAHYDPSTRSITVYTDKRHPKDILRSLSHELVHHRQNCDGKFDKMGQLGDGYAQNDKHLRLMEKEAYLEGNMCVRDWEDQKSTTIGERKMNTKQWSRVELNTLLMERFGYEKKDKEVSEKKDKKLELTDDTDEDLDNDGKVEGDKVPAFLKKEAYRGNPDPDRFVPARDARQRRYGPGRPSSDNRFIRKKADKADPDFYDSLSDPDIANRIAMRIGVEPEDLEAALEEEGFSIVSQSKGAPIMSDEEELDYEMALDPLAGIGSGSDRTGKIDSITESKIRETVRSLLKVKKIRKRK